MNNEVELRAIVRQSVPSLLVVLLLLGGIELGLRSTSVAEALPMPLVYYIYDVPRRLYFLERQRQKFDEPDVLFIGSSAVRAAFDPKTFDKTMRARTGRAVTSFNGGFSMMYPTGAAAYVEHVWLKEARPRYLFHGVRETELASDQVNPRYFKEARIESRWFTDSKLEHLQADILQNVRLLQYAGTLDRVIERWAKGKPLNSKEKGENVTDARGWAPRTIPLAKNEAHHSKHLWTYDKRVKPDRYKHSPRALERILAACKAHGVQYVLVTLPEHVDRFKGKRAPRVWEAYQRDIQAWAKAHDVPYLDVTDGDFEKYGNDAHYSDYHHMTPAGGRRFSAELAERFAAYLAAARK